MGVSIYGVKLGKRVGDNDKYNELLEKYEELDKEVIAVREVDKWIDFNPKIEKGVYLIDGHTDDKVGYPSFSYSGYGDFIDIFERMGAEEEGVPSRFYVEQYQTIDGTYDFSVCEDILTELKEYYDKIVDYIKRWDSGDYGEFIIGMLDSYMRQLEYVVSVKGVMRHH